MHHAVTVFPTEYCMPPTELAPELESRGFESLWVAEHSHIPASRLSPWPGGPELPQMYYDAMDPFVWLSAAASVTKTLKVATGICLVVQRDPIQTAKQVASLDRLSNGRFLFGIGGGWTIEERTNHGTAGEGRCKLMRERIEAMKEIWSKDEATYEGEHVSFDRIIANPKPVQKPHPPIHVGGGFPGGLRRAVRYGNGWIPIVGAACFRSSQRSASTRTVCWPQLARHPGRPASWQWRSDSAPACGRSCSTSRRTTSISLQSNGSNPRWRRIQAH